MTADIEKLKALALAPMQATTAVKAEQALVDFHAAANPATVLELIADRDKASQERDELRAEIERLRAELTAGAARQCGLSNLDGIPKREWWLIDREGDEEYVKVSDVLAAIAAHNKAKEPQ